MSVPLDHPSGLGPAFSRLPWAAGVTAGPVVALVGPAAHAGVGRALPSSACCLTLTHDEYEASVWVAVPDLPGEPERGLAPIYLHGGQRVVLPTVRLFAGESPTPEYLSLSHWLADAIERWQFETTHGATATVAERAGELPPSAALDLVAIAVRYALLGSARYVRRYGLTFPRMSMWARPAGDGVFALRAARSLVVTARHDSGTPRGTTAKAHRVSPTRQHDRGLDPFHTPEGTEIRLTGRLGVGVGIKDDRTLAAPATGVTLGPSSGRLPFVGYNDPRRLLMAANMQVQAVEVEAGEAPRVTAEGDGPDPPGVNLRVGYLAWGGWNHEDAWVISESAAARLAARETAVAFLERRALELDEPLAAKQGQSVRRGELLIARRYAPALLTDDLAALTALQTLDETVTVEPELGDHAPDGGEVTAVEEWDLLAEGKLPAGWVAAPGLTARCRRLFRVTFQRRLPLEVGDKLANRHGHKGVVGLVLPDAEMPKWRGEPLEALIDPVSVLNRSNWGQLHESVEAGPEPQRDADGRSPLILPDGRAVRAVAGVQFVMRLPQNAADKIAGSPMRDPAGELRTRAQRFGEMDDWAAWGHGLVSTAGKRFTRSAARLADLLGGAGFRLTLSDGCVKLASLKLADDPPPEFECIPLPAPGTLAEQYAALDADGGPRAVVFDPAVELPPEDREPPVKVRWLPLIPAHARPPQRSADGTEELHELTVLLRSLVRVLRKRAADLAAVGYAVRRLMREAYSAAVGRTAAGTDSSKGAWLRRGVLGRRVVPSARAVVSPSAGLGLALDEIGLPPVLAHTLFGPELPEDVTTLAERVNGRTVWLKRDPVLHRWGLLPVRVKVVAGHTIRLPASLLGPLGADYDGDTVAVFAALPGSREPTDACRPPGIAWDGDATGRAMFFPTKQYLYGLHLLRRRPELRAAFDHALSEAGAPTWPSGKSAKDELQTWVRLAATQATPDGTWWAVVERQALAALAGDPGMALGLLSIDAIRGLDVLAAGAVKDLYGEGAAGTRMAELLRGDGLKTFAAVTEGDLDSVNDPISGVMAAAKVAVGRFGGALRRLLYSLPRLTPELVRAAQTLTEQITQKALSVKAGEPPVSVAEFESELRRLLKGEAPPTGAVTPLQTLLAQPRMRAEWEQLRAELGGDVPVWSRWLRTPHELHDLLSPGTELALPLTDPRAGSLAE